MKTIRETNLYDFNAWAGGKDMLDKLTYEECKQLEWVLEDIYPDGMSETTLNDILWFDDAWILEEVLDMDADEVEEFWNR